MTSQKLTRELDWFLRSLEKKYKVKALVADVAVEAVELGKEEVDCFYLPKESLAELPETLLYEIMIVDDEERNEWIGAVAFYPDSPEWCLQVITKNGQLLYRKPLPVTELDSRLF